MEGQSSGIEGGGTPGKETDARKRNTPVVVKSMNGDPSRQAVSRVKLEFIGEARYLIITRKQLLLGDVPMPTMVEGHRWL